jgi:hypothetical protein
MNVSFNYGGELEHRYQNSDARRNRSLMRQLKLPYTWKNAQTMKKVRAITNSISNANLQSWYRHRLNNNEGNVPFPARLQREITRIKRELGRALGRPGNNRDVYFIFANAWGFGEYISNNQIVQNENGRDQFRWKNVNRDAVVGRLAKKFGRDTSKAELTRFKKAFFRKITRNTPRDLETLKRILRSTPILIPRHISGVNNLNGRMMPIRAIRNAANYVYVQPNIYNSNSNNDNSNSGPSNSNRSANYIANTNRVRRNAIRNAVNRNIEWQTKVVNTLPRDAVSLQNFKNGSKAVNIGYNRYVSPATFRALARTSMIQAYNRNGNAILFQNPFTRNNLKRSNLKFVVFRTKNAAARKIQKAFRSRPRAKAAMAALKRKRAV